MSSAEEVGQILQMISRNKTAQNIRKNGYSFFFQAALETIEEIAGLFSQSFWPDCGCGEQVRLEPRAVIWPRNSLVKCFLVLPNIIPRTLFQHGFLARSLCVLNLILELFFWQR